MDLQALADIELDTLRIEVITEQERRANLAAIPATVAMLSAQFVAAGGEQTELEAAIVPASESV